MKNADCTTLEEFRALAPEKLFAVWQHTRKEVKGGMCFPCIDGRLVVDNGTAILSAGKQKNIPYMAGANSEDMMPPIMQDMAKSWYAAQDKDSYVWHFQHQLPGDDNGAWHSADLWYWFGTLENCWRPMTDADRALSDAMTDCLCRFAATGDPNAAGEINWLPAQTAGKQAMCFGNGEPHMGKPSMLKMIITMLTNKSVGE